MTDQLIIIGSIGVENGRTENSNDFILLYCTVLYYSTVEVYGCPDRMVWWPRSEGSYVRQENIYHSLGRTLSPLNESSWAFLLEIQQCKSVQQCTSV